MRTKKEIDEMYSFVGYFNEGKFMNQDYRKGILDALSFVNGVDNNLTQAKKVLNIFEQKPECPQCKCKDITNDQCLACGFIFDMRENNGRTKEN